MFQFILSQINGIQKAFSSLRINASSLSILVGGTAAAGSGGLDGVVNTLTGLLGKLTN